MKYAIVTVGSCLRTDARSPEKKKLYFQMAKAGEITRMVRVLLYFKKPFVNHEIETQQNQTFVISHPLTTRN